MLAIAPTGITTIHSTKYRGVERPFRHELINL